MEETSEYGLPRGLRNCNPGNIRKGADKWQGLREEQTDPGFFQFINMRYGYRALLKLLQNYRRKHGCTDIASFIRRYAPASENNTLAYINAVCYDLQVPSTYVPDVTDEEVMCAFAAAMSYVEHGVPAVLEDVEGGWDLL